MPHYGKTMGFIANFLDQMQGRMVRRQFYRFCTLADEQGFEAGPTPFPLGDADTGEMLQAEFGEDCVGNAQLPFASIDQDQIGGHRFFGRHLFVTPGSTWRIAA